MFYKEATAEYRETTSTRGVGVDIDVQVTEAEEYQAWLAAERKVDSALADSFPASDPPSWTLGFRLPAATTSGERTVNRRNRAPRQ